MFSILKIAKAKREKNKQAKLDKKKAQEEEKDLSEQQIFEKFGMLNGNQPNGTTDNSGPQ